jgi:hypothetical protein
MAREDRDEFGVGIEFTKKPPWLWGRVFWKSLKRIGKKCLTGNQTVPYYTYGT